MAARRPVVSTPVGIVPNLIADGVNGRIVPIGDAAALAGAVSDLLGDPASAQRFAKLCRDKALAECSAEVMIDRILRVYKSLDHRTGNQPQAVAPHSGA